jgi:hypothetical protein
MKRQKESVYIVRYSKELIAMVRISKTKKIYRAGIAFSLSPNSSG